MTPPPVLNSEVNATRGVSAASRSIRKDKNVEVFKATDFALRVKYNNTLPEIPFDPKYLAYPFDTSRFVQYKQTSLEKNYKYDLHTEPDLGVHIDLINPDTYAIPDEEAAEGEEVKPSVAHHPTDLKLLEDETSPSNTETRRSAQHSKMVPWLRKTEYISSEFNRYGTASERHETQVGYNVKKKLTSETFYKDRDSQIKAIEESFDAVKTPVTEHYAKPGVHAVQELPVFPDFEHWNIALAQVVFDADPLPSGADRAVVSQALIRGMMDTSGEQFVAYFIPTDETLEKRLQPGVDMCDPEHEYEYKLAREYNWIVKNKASKGYEENYFLTFRDNAVFYDELETRVRLSKRRHQEGSVRVAKSKLSVKYREMNEQEKIMQDARLLQLQNVVEAEDEEPEPMEENEAGETAEEVNEAEDAADETGEVGGGDKDEDKEDAESVKSGKSETEEKGEGNSEKEDEEVESPSPAKKHRKVSSSSSAPSSASDAESD